jgi:hypothetical protein
MGKIKHFWASKQARKWQDSAEWLPGIRLPWVFAMIKGRVVRYDIMASTKKHGCMWPDMVYLGGGVFHHAEKSK